MALAGRSAALFLVFVFLWTGLLLLAADGADSVTDEDADTNGDDVINDTLDEGESSSTFLDSHARAGGHQHDMEHGRKSHGGKSRSIHHNKVMQDVKKANEHYLRIRTQAPCKEARPRVIKVKDVYPDTSKEYLPRCTLLHRCGNDVGCCDHETMQCVAKTTQTVHLHFYILFLSTEKGTVSVIGGGPIERLSFLNHTECECQIVSDRPRVGSSNQHHSKCPECPGDFSVREHPNGACSCDCFDRQKHCLRLKRGRETLGDADRRCVESGRCNAPECEYGIYDIAVGRCPRKHERRNSASVGHQWWRMDDRD